MLGRGTGLRSKFPGVRNVRVTLYGWTVSHRGVSEEVDVSRTKASDDGKPEAVGSWGTERSRDSSRRFAGACKAERRSEIISRPGFDSTQSI